MIPVKFTIKNDITYFHYKFSELKKFVKLGKKDGNVGMILIKRKGNLLTYKGFGTIENPFNDMVNFSFAHFEPMDGKMPTDEERLKPGKPFFTSENTKIIMLDLNEIKINKINK